jgi:hypothetical protein
MAWKYKYDSLSQFVTDYQTAVGLWTEYGRIDSVQITPFTNPANDGYVIMFAVQPGSKIRNLNRFSFSLTQFLNLNFSKEIPGINVYISEQPNIRNVNSWDLLSPNQKQYYQGTAIKLIADNYLRVYWPPEPIETLNPVIQVRIDTTILSPASTYSLQSFLNEEKIIRIYVRNIGVNALEILQPPSLSDTLYYQIIRNLNKTSIIENDQDYIDIRLYSNVLGFRSTVLTIRTNDPARPIFSFEISSIVELNISSLAPQISLTTSPLLNKVENGQSIEVIDFIISTIKTYNNIDYIVLKDVNNNEIIRFNNPNASGGTNYYEWIPGNPITNDTSITAYVADINNNQNADTFNIDFMNKVYWGYNPASTLDSAQIRSLNSNLREYVSGTYEFGVNFYAPSGTSVYLYLAYPKYLGEIQYVDDIDNGFTYLPPSFLISEINFTNQNGYTTPYKVYRTNNKTFGNDLTWYVTMLG